MRTSAPPMVRCMVLLRESRLAWRLNDATAWRSTATAARGSGSRLVRVITSPPCWYCGPLGMYSASITGGPLRSAKASCWRRSSQ